VVLTIDPARRLAQSMGLTELDNTPRAVAGIDASAGGSLDAMMLDMKRTFDEIVVAHAEPGKAQAILDNPFYQALSSSFAGTQEYMAMEKLGQLRATGDHDLVVVDTPPTRSALDFLDAPERMTTLMDGRMVRILVAPAKAGGKAYLKVVTTGFSVFTSAITRIIGAQVLQDVSQFVAALETMFGGFRERAQTTYDLLKSPGTQFVVVAAPERDALREASYFVERLAEESMPLAGLVVNRVHRSAATTLSADRALSAAEQLEQQAETGVTPRWLPASCACTPSGCRCRCASAGCRSGSAARTPASRCGGRGAARRRPRPRRAADGRRRPRRRARGDRPDRGRASYPATRSAPACSRRACSSSCRHEVTSGRRRSSARRSRSVMPPQTPNSTRLSSASDRHSVRTGQPRQTALARFCAAPVTNRSSGSASLHAERALQSCRESAKVPVMRVIVRSLREGEPTVPASALAP
jgi:anion-transporting  ArsA/GET3 family ATPase